LACGIPSGADILLVFGGDGTFVSIARQCLEFGIPIAGINFGRVGFLAELTGATWEEALAAACERGFSVEARMTLRYALFRENVRVRQGEVVNDVVVTRGRAARLVNLHLGVNGTPFVSLRADGVIFSTPTGSTAYSGSAGGSLLSPALNAYVVAAVCPYLSSFPPLVLSADTVFSLTVDEATEDLYLTLDGQEVFPLLEGDRLDIAGVPERLLVADFGRKNYFRRLLQAGFVQEMKRLE
jgi:NAD+ kinase